MHTHTLSAQDESETAWPTIGMWRHCGRISVQCGTLGYRY